MVLGGFISRKNVLNLGVLIIKSNVFGLRHKRRAF